MRSLREDRERASTPAALVARWVLRTVVELDLPFGPFRASVLSAVSAELGGPSGEAFEGADAPSADALRTDPAMDAPSIHDPSTDAPSTHAPSTDTPSPLALLAIREARPLDATLPEGTPTHALARFFGLSDPQAEALALLMHPVFTTLVAHCTRPEPRAHVVAAALDLAPHELDALFAPYAWLRTTGLVDEALRPTELVRHCLQSAVSAEDLDAWVREEPSGHCTLDDFSYGGPRVEVLARQLALAARERRAM